MPYKLSRDGKAVMVFKNGKWRLKKRYYGKDAKKKAAMYKWRLEKVTGH